MADAILGTAIEKLVELLIEEAKSLKGVAGEIEGLRGEFEIIQSFLNDVDARSSGENSDQTVKTWIRQVRDEAGRINDVVDHYLSLKAEQQSQCCRIKSVQRHRFLASEIQSIKESLNKIKDRAERFGLKPLQREHSVENHDLRIGSLFVEKDELVGVDLILNELIERLVKGPSERVTAFLAGQGGVGKTTLAKKVYEDEAVKEHFDCQAWITVSRSYDAKKLLKLAGSQLFPEENPAGESVSIELLIDRLRKNLQNKKYLIVFDDVWQIGFWETVKHALPNNGRSGRVIMTTRNTSIPQSMRESPFDFSEEMNPWSPEPAYELFRKRAFRFELNGNCPEELEDLSREILTKCHGLPLVIAAIAGMLSTKEKSVREWKRVSDNLKHELETNPQLSSISKILSLSYHDLPHHLRSCFLYFGMFPESSSIFDGKLYRLWIAEGFIKPVKDKNPEDVAEEYLSELVYRNLVSVETKYGFRKWCKVHDLMRDVILTVADELSFLRIVTETDSDRAGKYRRLSLQNATLDALKTIGEFTARSVFLFNVDAESANFFAGKLLGSFRLLKVLNFQSAPIERLPREISNLFLLEYLNLKGTTLKELPKSIGKLQNLLTLDIRDTLIHKLPIELYKLRKLQHLLAYRLDEELEYNSNSFPGVTMNDGIGNLQALQTLTHVELNPNQEKFIEDLANLQNLKLLSLSKLTAKTARSLGDSVGKMNSLEDLSLTSMDEAEVLDLDRASSIPKCRLRYLSLKCRLLGFPKWVSELQNLSGLSLRFSGLSEDPLRHVSDLPGLTFLRLYQAFDGDELCFEEGGFRKLKQLEMRTLKGLKRVRIRKGALTLLEELTFGDFPLMSDVAFDFQRLTSLKTLEISDMGREFVARLQPEGGTEYWRIEHVRSVRFTFKLVGKSFGSYRLGSTELLQPIEVDKN